MNRRWFMEGVNFLKNLPKVVPDATRFQPNSWRNTSSIRTTAVWEKRKQPIHILTQKLSIILIASMLLLLLLWGNPKEDNFVLMPVLSISFFISCIPPQALTL